MVKKKEREGGKKEINAYFLHLQYFLFGCQKGFEFIMHLLLCLTSFYPAKEVYICFLFSFMFFPLPSSTSEYLTPVSQA